MISDSISLKVLKYIVLHSAAFFVTYIHKKTQMPMPKGPCKYAKRRRKSAKDVKINKISHFVSSFQSILQLPVAGNFCYIFCVYMVDFYL